MAGFIAELPGFVGLVIGSGIVLLLISRAALAVAPKRRGTATGLLLIYFIILIVVLPIIAAGYTEGGFPEAALANVLGAIILFGWDLSRLRRKSATTVVQIQSTGKAENK